MLFRALVIKITHRGSEPHALPTLNTAWSIRAHFPVSSQPYFQINHGRYDDALIDPDFCRHLTAGFCSPLSVVSGEAIVV